MWQDYAMFIANIMLSVGLFSQVYHAMKSKKAGVDLSTSAMGASAVALIAVALLTLDLYLSAFLNAIVALLWAFLFAQKLMYKK